MHLHITNKLQQKLHVPMATAFPGVDVRYLRWYANLFRANRLQYILTTHATSLYSVVLPGRGITDGATYLQALWPALEWQLALDGMTALYERHIAPHRDGVVFVKTADRSVLGSMTDMARVVAVRLERVDPHLTPLQLGADLNGIPFKSIGYRYPRKVFAQLNTDKETLE